MTKANCHVGEFFIIQLGQDILIIIIEVMLGAKLVQSIKSRVLAVMPLLQALGFEIVLIVLEQFLITATSYAKQLKLGLGRRLAVNATLNYVLLSAACRLYHLVDSAVAISWEELPGKHPRQLI